MIISRFIFMPLKALMDIEARTVETCESKASGRAILGDDWGGIPRVDYLDAGDPWYIGPPLISRQTDPRKHGVVWALKLSARDLYTVTAALGEVHLMRNGKLPSWRYFQGYFYGAFPTVKTMCAAAYGIKVDPEQTAFIKRAIAADPARWGRIRVATARQRIGQKIE